LHPNPYNGQNVKLGCAAMGRGVSYTSSID